MFVTASFFLFFSPTRSLDVCIAFLLPFWLSMGRLKLSIACIIYIVIIIKNLINAIVD